MRKILLFAFALSVLSGCTRLGNEVRPAPASGDGTEQAELSPQLMYQLLLVEMMASRGEHEAAFKLLEPLVEKRADPQLARRLFQLSMQTWRPEAIERASTLWHRIEPQAADPLRALWLLKLREGDVDGALALFDRYQKVTPAPLQEDLELAAQRVAGAISAETAIRFASALRKRYPGWAAELAAGRILLEKGRASEAMDAFDAALAKGGEPARIYPLMARAWLAMGHAQAGLKRLKDYVAAHPDNWQLQAEYARLEVEVGDFAAAEKRFQQVLASQPDADVARLALGLLQFEQGKLDAARAQFEQLLRNPVTAQAAAWYLGQVLERQGKLKEAANYYVQVSDPRYRLSAQLRLVDILYQLQGLDAALKLLDRISARNDAEQAKLLVARASLYARAGQRDRALAVAKKLLTHPGADRDTLMQLAGVLYELKADTLYEQAVRKVLTLAPEDADALNALGYFYVERNRNLDEAERLLWRALKNRPKAFYIEDSIGWLYWRKGDLDRAVQWLERALARQADPEVLVHLLQVHRQRRDYPALKRLRERYRSLIQRTPKLQTLWRKIETEMRQAPVDPAETK